MLSIEKRLFAKIARLNIKKKTEKNPEKVKEINAEIAKIKAEIKKINNQTIN